MKDNDVYRWHWKPGMEPMFGRYSNRAVVVDGELLDTFWHDWRQDKHRVDPDRAELTFLGNIDECREIKSWEVPYYDPADVISMAHSNNSGAPIYLTLTAGKSQSWMLARAEEKLADAQRAKERAERDIAEWNEKVSRVKAGDLEVYL
jgi:hypothetical protein